MWNKLANTNVVHTPVLILSEMFFFQEKDEEYMKQSNCQKQICHFKRVDRLKQIFLYLKVCLLNKHCFKVHMTPVMNPVQRALVGSKDHMQKV